MKSLPFIDFYNKLFYFALNIINIYIVKKIIKHKILDQMLDIYVKGHIYKL